MSGRHRDKVRPTVADALEPMFDGARVMVGGFGLCGNAEALIAGVVERGVKDLHLISNNAGNLGKGLAQWLRAGIIGKVTCTYLGNNQDLHDAREGGVVGRGLERAHDPLPCGRGLHEPREEAGIEIVYQRHQLPRSGRMARSTRS